jgi:hypothetical protein
MPNSYVIRAKQRRSFEHSGFLSAGNDFAVTPLPRRAIMFIRNGGCSLDQILPLAVQEQRKPQAMRSETMLAPQQR